MGWLTATAGAWTSMTETARRTVTGTVDPELGYAVAIRGNTIAVDGFDSTSTIGAAYVFEKPAGGWTDMTQPATLTSSVASDSFGFSLAMDEHTVLVGAPEGGRTLRRLMQCNRAAKMDDVVGYAVGFYDKTVFGHRRE